MSEAAPPWRTHLPIPFARFGSLPEFPRAARLVPGSTLVRSDTAERSDG